MEESPIHNQVTSLTHGVIRSHPLLELFFGGSDEKVEGIPSIAITDPGPASPDLNLQQTSVKTEMPPMTSMQSMQPLPPVPSISSMPFAPMPSISISGTSFMEESQNDGEYDICPHYTSTDGSSDTSAIDSDDYLDSGVEVEDMKMPTVGGDADSVDSIDHELIGIAAVPNEDVPFVVIAPVSNDVDPDQFCREESDTDSISVASNSSDDGDGAVSVVSLASDPSSDSSSSGDEEEDNFRESNEVEDPSEMTDTLKSLLATPLATTNEDFTKKYPEKIVMVPASNEPIPIPRETDILFGRGGLTNHHPGNKRYRVIVTDHKPDYTHAAKMTKPRVARRIVYALRHANPPARFLRKAKDGMWRDVGDKVASEKTSQALREKSPEERKVAAAKKWASKTTASEHHSSLSTANDVSVADTHSSAPINDENFMHHYFMENHQGINSNATHGGLCGPPNGFPPDNTHLVKSEADGCITTSIPNTIGHMTSSNTYSYPTNGGVFGAMDSEGHIVVTDFDVLCGRGGASNNHKGNKIFRSMVAFHREAYQAAGKSERSKVASTMVRTVRSTNPPGRFLKKSEDGYWVDIGDEKASDKACQAMKDKGYAIAAAAKPVETIPTTFVPIPAQMSIAMPSSISAPPSSVAVHPASIPLPLAATVLAPIDFSYRIPTVPAPLPPVDTFHNNMDCFYSAPLHLPQEEESKKRQFAEI